MRIPNSKFWILFCLSVALLCGEIIDRIAVTVGNQVITQSQIDDEVRVTAFLNRERLALNVESRKAAAKRLIEQALIKHELDLSRYPLPELTEANISLDNLRAMYPSGADFEAALQAYDITPDELRRRLWWQLTLLRFIEYRFRPGIQVPASDVQAYYRQQVSQWEQKGTKPIPTLEESRAKIEEILTQKRIDEALEQWMKDTRNQLMIAYRDPGLQ